MPGRNAKITARARLTWQAEREFGLESVSVTPEAGPAGSPAPAAASGPAPTPAAAPGSAAMRENSLRAPAKPPAASAKPTPLFKGMEPSRPVAVPQVSLPVVEPLSGPPLAAAEKRAALDELNSNHVKGCVKCRLCESRTQTVFGEGDTNARIMFIGEGPGENEDLSGRPFVGRAGELLERMIRGMGLEREQVFICNIVKCRPPGNRAPMPDETAACTPYLERQIEVIRPEVIVTLGAPAAKYILRNDKISITRLRGTWHEYRGIKVMPTFHPAYILRQYTAEVRGQVWSDLQQVLKALGMKVPKAPR